MYLKLIKYGLSEGISKGAPFIVSLYIAAVLNPVEYSRYGLLIVYYEIAFIIISINIQATTRISYVNEQFDKFEQITKVHLIISIFIFIIAFFAVCVYESVDIFLILILIISAMLRTFVSLIMAVFQCSNNENNYIVSSLVYSFFISSLTIIFINIGYGIESWSYALLLATFIQFNFCINRYGIKKIHKLLLCKIEKKLFKSTLFFASAFYPQAIGWWLKSGADRLTIERFNGEEVLGNYTLAFQLTSLIILFATVINLAIVPIVGNNLKLKKSNVVVKILSLNSIIIVLVGLLVILSIQLILSYNFFSDYKLIDSFIYLFSIAAIVQSLMMLVINVLYYSNKGNKVAISILILFTMQVCINYLLIDKIGVEGMIMNSILFNFLGLVYFIFEANKIMKKGI